MIDRPVQRALLAAGHAAADEVQAALAQRGLAAAGVGEVRVAAVDDDVALVQQRDQLVDHRVGGLARLDHDDDRARPLQRGDEVRRSTRSGRTCPRRRARRPGCGCARAVRLCSATGYPWRARLRARLRPITARPVTPICAACSVIRGSSESLVVIRASSPLRTRAGPMSSRGKHVGDNARDELSCCPSPAPVFRADPARGQGVHLRPAGPEHPGDPAGRLRLTARLPGTCSRSRGSRRRPRRAWVWL